MAQVENFNPDPDVEDLMIKGVKILDRYGSVKIQKKRTIYSRSDIEELESMSVMAQIAQLWEAQSSAKKNAWNNAATYCGLTGYQLFQQDTAFRLLNGIPGIATPNVNYQYKVLILDTGPYNEDFSTYCGVFEQHYPVYSIRQKIEGKKNSYRWVEIEENPSGTFTVGWSIYNNFIECGASPYFEISLWCYGKKGGVDASDHKTWSIPFVQSWNIFSDTFTPDLDTIEQYGFYIEHEDLEGYYLIDNLVIEHSGQNWAFDPHCNNSEYVIIKVGDEYYYAYDIDLGFENPIFESVYLDES